MSHRSQSKTPFVGSHWHLLNTRIRFAPDDGTGAPAATEAAAPVDKGTTEAPENKDKDFFATNNNMWETKVTLPDPAAAAAADEQRVKDTTALENYAKTRAPDLQLDPAVFAEAMQKGDPSILAKAFKESSTAMYHSLLSDMARMVTESQKGTRTEVEQIAARRLNTDKSEAALDAALPFIAGNNALRPIAQSVMGAFLRQGKTREEAVSMTQDFFKHTSKLTTENFDDLKNPPSGRSNNRSRGAEPNWADILSGKE